MEYTQLAPGLKISRIITGLWQIADMERGGKSLDPKATAQHMIPYTDNGLTSFDMADHYGSAEIIAGEFKNNHFPGCQLLTKWVPKPEKNTRETVKTAVELALSRMQIECLDLLQFHAWDYANPDWLDCLFWLLAFIENSIKWKLDQMHGKNL